MVRKLAKRIQRINETLAMLGTHIFGSMWTFYVFFIWGTLGMLPWVPGEFKNVVLLISSAWIQLWALPLIAVGTAVSGRKQEHRSLQDHEMLIKELELLKKQQEMWKQELLEDRTSQALLQKILETLARMESKLKAE